MAGKTEVRSEEMEEHKVLFHHVTEQGKAVFDIMDESNGTRNLLFLAAPVLNILNKGLTLVIDELDNSLHTLLVRELVRLFHRPEINTGGAQLILLLTIRRCWMHQICSGEIKCGSSKKTVIKHRHWSVCLNSALVRMKH